MGEGQDEGDINPLITLTLILSPQGRGNKKCVIPTNYALDNRDCRAFFLSGLLAMTKEERITRGFPLSNFFPLQTIAIFLLNMAPV